MTALAATAGPAASRSRSRVLIATTLVGCPLLFCGLVSGQTALDPADVCSRELTIAACEEAVTRSVAALLGVEPAEADLAAAAESAAREGAVVAATERVESKNTGSGATIDSRSGVLDYLFRLAVSAETGSLGGGDESVTLELNDLFGLATDQGYKLTAQLRQAEVSERLLESFPEEARAAQAEALDKQLDDLDDAELAFSWSPVNERFGRDPGQHDALWDALFAAAKRSVEGRLAESDRWAWEQDVLIEELFDFEELAGELSGEGDDPAKDLTFERIAEVDPRLAADLLVATVRSQETYLERNRSLDAALEAIDFLALADLADNQPQIEAKLRRSFPDELVGAAETRLTATYQHGFANVNRLRESLEECGLGEDEIERIGDGQGAQKVGLFEQCYARFLQGDGSERLRVGQRVTASLDWHLIDDLDVDLGDGLRHVLPSQNKLTFSAAWGRYLSFDDLGDGRSRVDLSWAYEWVENEMVRNRRSVLELTYAQKVGAGMILSTGLVWANKPEFVGEVDKEISARVGLRYRIFKKKEL